MIRRIAIALLAAGLAYMALPAFAQTAHPSPAPSPSPIADPNPCGGPSGLLAVLDRPTIGFSACAVAPGTTLFELGYQNEVGGSGGNAFVQTQYPQNFLRVGVAPRVELDLIGPNEVRQRSLKPTAPDSVTNGAFDSGLGAKYEFPQRGAATFAIDGLYTAPSGSPDFTAGNASYTLNLDIAYPLTPNTGIGTTLGFTSTGGFATNGAHARYGAFLPSVVVTESLPHDYQPYFEYVYASRLSPSVGGRAYIDYGIQKLFGSRTEVDVELGHALSAKPSLKFNYIGVGLGLELQ